MNSMLSAILLFALTFFGNCSKKGGSPTPAPVLAKISVSDLSRPEGNTALVPFSFTLTLDRASSQTVTVTCTAVEGFARINTDFVQATQTVSFAPNETQKTVTINVIGDDLKEGDDDFKIVLSDAVNGVIYKGIGLAVIENDDSRVGFTNAGYDAPATYPGYALAWADEFNGTTLSMSDWSFENGDGCPGICGWGNNELEYYTGRPENLFFQDGKMIIEARKENYSGKNYTSSKILTRGKKTFKFGRFDIRAKLPKGKGIWPAFWLLPQNNVFGGWPKSGEIDLMEMIGHEPNRSYGTLHFGPGPGSTQLGRNYTLPSGIFNDEFHVFSLEWKQDQIKWFIDGNIFSTYTNADFGSNNYPFNEDFFFIVNLAVGGNWPGGPDAATYFPQWLIVDYIRVYQ
ncbi:MAG TPA: family 16 glycosylhydrolase [Chitinophagaceae bacterium]|nr:family 16 glycosylhydrolase [Chitinophagaceae bacterium]